MRVVLAIAAKDLRQRLRDRSAWVIVFLAPVLITALMALAFTNNEDFRADIGVVDLDRGTAATGLTQVLRSPELEGTVRTRSYGAESDARRAVDAGDVHVAIVVPAGFTEALNGGGSTPVRILDSVDYGLQAQLARAVTESYVAQVNADRLSVATAVAAGAPRADVPRLAARAAVLRLPEQVRAQGLPDDPLKVISYFGPSMGMFFVLFTVGFGARGYFVEQQQGTLDRIAAAPVGRGALLLGKSVSTFVYSLASLTTVTLVSWLVFDARWADPVGVAALSVALAVCVVTLTALVISLVRTEQQAQGLSSVLVFALVLLGGNFVFASGTTPTIRRLALFTPNGWALRGFTDLGTGVRGWDAVGAPLLGIAAFSAAVAVVTVLLLRLRRTT
ncbi:MULTISPECIES: ABC transporter permease [unclassified Streptomyces]|uniref:ABC transporter permease n=1 Tax=unclassified Streptomyces TaxID=2593676 RepID=UPI0024745499|nr:MULTISPECIES: ABC transporter permease [unclassified Streptomyces]MDH6447651.1 ABC-2 type transport system permease protein [Streptomyces sp. SAI-119]MDH6501626.1 ABC-2 type transport system permease protein [Streptomyces sp. SAI-149]